MSLETGTFVQDLVVANPPGSDAILQGDDHLRLMKTCLDNTFPNATQAFYFPEAIAKTANYTILAADMNKFFAADATAGAFNLTLPTLGASNDGWYVVIQKTDSSENAVTVVGTINGVANMVLPAQYNSVLVWWSGTAWYALALNASTKVQTITGSGTLTLADVDNIILCNPGGATTLTLPAAAGWTGRTIIFKQITAAFATVLDGNGAETIDGLSTYTLSLNNEVVILFSDGTNVRILATFNRVNTTSFEVVFDAGTAALTTGIKLDLRIPFACTIQEVMMLADQSGSLVVDIWKDTYANFPPTDADSITAAAPPTISAATKSQDATLTGWTTAIAADSILRFNIDSITGIQRCTLSLKVIKT